MKSRRHRERQAVPPQVQGHAGAALEQKATYIQVEVETPKNLSRKQRDLLKSFEEASNPSTSPASTGFFARVKDFFEGIRE